MTSGEDAQPRAYFYDGLTGKRYEPEVRFEPHSLVIEISRDDPPIRWKKSELRLIHHHHPKSELAIGRTDDPDPILVLVAPDLQALFRREMPAFFDQETIKRKKLKPLAITAGFLAGIAAFVFILGPIIAKQIAFVLPPSVEQKMADEMDPIISAFGDKCHDEAAIGILQDVAVELSRDLELQFPLKIEIRELGMVNAFALPAGHIIISGELIDAADTSGEVVGVLAHEIGHVAHRHLLTRTIKENFVDIALTALVGFSDFGLGLEDGADLLLSTGYSRADETEADETAIELMNKADFRADGLASFFDTLKNHGPGFSLPEVISTHPNDDDRVQLVKETATGRNEALSEKDWETVRDACG